MKKNDHRLLTAIESGILLFVWLLLFLIPVWIEYQGIDVSWHDILQQWKFLAFFFALNLLNHFVLVPYIFFNNTKRIYLVTAIATAVIFVVLLEFNKPKDLMRSPPPPPGNEMPPPQHEYKNEKQAPRNHKPPPQPNTPYFNLQEAQHNPLLAQPLILALLLLAADTGLRTVFKWIHSEKEREILEKEKVQSELAFLRNQVSPHFFMNTMNNIHALIEVDPEMAQKSVIQLSKMMRYLLYESNEGNTPLSKEIEFIMNYAGLMKQRYSSKVSITLSFPDTVPEVSIPPLLFTSIVENAFKHGASYINESFIELVMQTDEEFLSFKLRNSKFDTKTEDDESGGLGLENLQKRLDLLYPKRHQLIKYEDENTFEINIKIPLYA